MDIKLDAKPKPNEQDQRITKNLETIKHRIVVFSGKGGVGKTTVAVNLSYALLSQGSSVGLLDADITGPNVPKMVGLKDVPSIDEGSKQIIPQIKDGLQVISIAPMIPADAPIIWRGPLRSGAITQFLSDVVWGSLDFLLADLPPGTGDEVLTTAQKMLPQIAIVVTTPQEVSLIDCRRAVNMAKKLEIKKIGVVENMSGLICPHCGENIDFFGSGGGEKMAEEMGVTFLGRVPMELATRKSGDEGKPVVVENPDSVTGKAFMEIAKNTVVFLNQ
ncbi:Mrp/NBP35 family ATP-binding protein [bacterium]|nr:Mrp/NBP35 family ATP-binding protein [bacterium]